MHLVRFYSCWPAQADGCSTLVVTGPNMGGKSVFIRQSALIAIMAQVRCAMLCCGCCHVHLRPRAPLCTCAGRGEGGS